MRTSHSPGDDFFLKNLNLSLFHLMAAFLAAFLHKVSSGQQQLSIGIPFHNRRSKEHRRTIGLFMQVVPLRLHVRSDLNLLELVQSLIRESKRGLDHRRFALGNPLHRETYDVILNLHPGSFGRFIDFPTRASWICPGHGNDSLALQVHDFDDTGDLHLDFDLHTDLFDPELRSRVPHHFLALIDHWLQDPDLPIRRLRILPPREERDLLRDFLSTSSCLPPSGGPTLIERLDSTASHRPSTIAVYFDSGPSLTYRKLQEQADRLAQTLRSLSAAPETVVGLCLKRSPRMIVALLGILKAKAAFLPLDPALPSERIAFLIEDARPIVILTEKTLRSRLPDLGAGTRIVDLDTDHEKIDIEPADRPRLDPPLRDRNAAYLLYTSGSTGSPKGVLVEHRSLVNYIGAAAESWDLQPTDRVLQFASLGFDTSLEEIFVTLLSGATLVLRTEEVMGSVETFFESCRKWEITVLDLPTAYWHEMMDQMEAGETGRFPQTVRLVILGGEKARTESWSVWNKHVGTGVRLLNTYGPTEATIVATQADLTAREREEDDISGQTVAIGRPLSNIQAYVLDADLFPVPAGVVGELYLGGRGLARGYPRHPDWTAECFIPDPFAPQSGGRLYRTGDRARKGRGGELEVLGRIDDQVKIRGQRVEPAEIENSLRRHPSVRDALVVPFPDEEPKETRLAAYVVPTGATAELPTPANLRDHLQRLLPAALIPSSFQILQRLPTTTSGKVDRAALPAPARGSIEPQGSSPPRDLLELHLAQCWEETLEIPSVGVEDHFFDLGGHSILAVRLMSRIEKRLGRTLPLSVLFQSPTVAGLARILRKNQRAEAWNPLVPIQPRGKAAPFFCVHPAGGDVLCYYHLSRHLCPEQPFFGLQARGVSGELEPFDSIEAMAACYLNAIRKVQPKPPYLLGGWSLGGTVAFEIALQLRRIRLPVARVLLFDTLAPIQRPKVDPTALLLNMVRDLDLHISKEHLADLELELQIEKVFESARREDTFPADGTLNGFRRSFNLFRTHAEAARAYRPGIFDGRVTLLKAEEVLPERLSDPLHHEGDLGWSRFTKRPIEILPIPGNHSNLIYDPHVESVAERLTRCFQQDSKDELLWVPKTRRSY